MVAATEAMVSGGVMPDEASAVAGVLEIHRKAMATEDHEQPDPARTEPVVLTREERTLCVHFVRCSPAT